MADKGSIEYLPHQKIHGRSITEEVRMARNESEQLNIGLAERVQV